MERVDDEIGVTNLQMTLLMQMYISTYCSGLLLYFCGASVVMWSDTYLHPVKN